MLKKNAKVDILRQQTTLNRLIIYFINIYIYIKLMVFLNNQFLFTFDNLKRRWRTSPCFEGFGKLNHSMSLIMRWRSLTRSESHTKLCSNFERRFSRLLTLISSKLWPYKNKNIHIKKWIKMNKSWNHCISIFYITICIFRNN